MNGEWNVHILMLFGGILGFLKGGRYLEMGKLNKPWVGKVLRDGSCVNFGAF